MINYYLPKIDKKVSASVITSIIIFILGECSSMFSFRSASKDSNVKHYFCSIYLNYEYT